MIHITNNTPDPVYFEGTHIAPGCSYIINPNPDMNAEQLAHDIASLDQAHRAADEALKSYPGLSIGAKVESLVKNNISAECSQATHKELSRVGTSPMGRLDKRVKELVDELLKRREDPALKEIREIVSKALGYSHEAISGTTTAGLVEMLARGCKDMRDHGFLEKLHREFDRAEPRYLGGVIERARRAVDELLKLRQQGAHAAGHIYDLNKQLEALKAEQGEIRRKVGEALGKDAMEIRALTTQEIVYMLIYRLGETKQGETNSSNLSEHDRLEIRAKLFKVLGRANDHNARTSELVSLVVGELQQTRDRAATINYFQQSRGAAYETQVHMMREALKVRESELAELNRKLDRAEDNARHLRLNAASLAPKEKWKALEVLGSVDLFSVVRGFECATPHPVSKGIADAIAGELNARG